MDIFRTPEDRFRALSGFPFEARYRDVTVDGSNLRMHYVDEGSGANGVFLMVHGMPTWSYLYRKMIPPLVAAGYRCIAPDHIGFGKSDKVLDDSWYSIERHCLALRSLIEALDLQRITLVCQDWGGPIGLRQAVDMPARFDRLALLNTWLHHEGYEYTPNIRRWQSMWEPGGAFEAVQGCGFVLQNYVSTFPAGAPPQLNPQEAFDAYEAPFPDRASKAGPRRFPLCIPIDGKNPEGAAEQQRCWDALLAWKKPVHFIWGTADLVFTEAWGREWAGHFPQSTFDGINAGHFLQETHGAEVAELLLGRIAEER